MKHWTWGLVVFSFLCGMLTPSLLQTPQYPSGALTAEAASPQDWVSEDDIRVYSDRIEIRVDNAKWASFADTNSMDPVFDRGANGIQIVPTRPEQLSVGDVITYDYGGRKIIHRIVEIGQDADGYYFLVKGDNNGAPDPQPVRWRQVERVLIAVVY